MSVNLGFAHLSNDFLIAALLIYSLAVLAFAGDYAFGRPRRAAAKAAKPAEVAQLAAVGAATAGARATDAGARPVAGQAASRRPGPPKASAAGRRRPAP